MPVSLLVASVSWSEAGRARQTDVYPWIISRRRNRAPISWSTCGPLMSIAMNDVDMVHAPVAFLFWRSGDAGFAKSKKRGVPDRHACQSNDSPITTYLRFEDQTGFWKEYSADTVD